MRNSVIPLSVILATAFLTGCGTTTTENKPSISAASILARTKVLSSDEFEGRGPGTPGEEKTVNYLVAEFKKLGLQPGNPNGTYIQNAPLVGIQSKPALKIAVGGQDLGFENINDYVAFSSRVAPRVEAKDTDVVFVGYGVVAPEYNWDDYKGVDVRGKTVVMLINDPPVLGADGKPDPKIFGGNAMTYYGRWTYKYEIAARKGAAACLIVHETIPAAYPFGVVVNSWTRENFEISTPDKNAGHIGLSGWLTLGAATKLFSAAGQDYSALKRQAVTREFKPVALNAKASFTVENTLREVASRNVIALLPGSDAKLKNEYVIYNAHWDHLGIDPTKTGDNIFNGAADNAAGTAVLLEIAQAFKALPAAQQPKRTVLFLAVTAEEKGLLGSRYYAQNPLHPLTKTVGVINMDGANQFGRTTDIEVIGHGASTIDDDAVTVARTQQRTIIPDTHPERGSYYRSDHFEFAKEGVPAFYGKSGKKFIGMPDDFGEKKVSEYIEKDYHKVSDEIKPDWTFEGAAQDTEFLMQLGLRIANADKWPEWRAGNEFKAKRDAMLKGGK